MHTRQRQEHEQAERRDLDADQQCVDEGALGRAEHQQEHDSDRDHHGGEVEPATGLRGGHQIRRSCSAERQLDMRHQCVRVTQDRGEMDAGCSEQPDRMVRPADRDRARAHRIFEDQRPADHPGQDLADHGVGVGVGGTRHRHHRGQLRIAERGHAAHKAGDDEAEQHAGAGLLRGFGGQHEDAGADHGADTQHGELEGTQRPVQRLLFRGRENRVQRLYTAEDHYALYPKIGHAQGGPPYGSGSLTANLRGASGEEIDRLR